MALKEKLQHISEVKKARENAKYAKKYFEDVDKISTCLKFAMIINKADVIMKTIDNEELQARKVRETAREAQAAREAQVQQDIIFVDDEEGEVQSEAIETDGNPNGNDGGNLCTVFSPPKKHHPGRKSTDKIRQVAEKAANSPNEKIDKSKMTLQQFKKHAETTENRKVMPIELWQWKGQDGSGLFEEKKVMKFVEERDDVKNWCWTEAKPMSKYGVVRCTLCDHIAFYKKKITSHISSAQHIANIADAKANVGKEEKKKKALRSLSVNKLLQIQSRKVSEDSFEHRKDAVRCAAAANIAISAMEEVDKSKYKRRFMKEQVSIGHISHLADDMIPIVHEEDLQFLRTILLPHLKKGDKRLGEKEQECRDKILAYEHFSIIFDGTPTFAACEAVMIRIVLKDGQVLTLLVRCKLLAKHSNGDELAHHILETIEKTIGLSMSKCRVIMCDRASTNKKALRLIKEKYPNLDEALGDDIDFLRMYCIAHTLSNAGKEMYNGNVTPWIHKLRKLWQSVVQYKGHARDLAKEKFGTTVALSGSIRFYVHYEQIVQLVDYGIDNLCNDILEECIRKKWSETSSKNLKEEFFEASNKAELGMAILEASAVADAIGASPSSAPSAVPSPSLSIRF